MSTEIRVAIGDQIPPLQWPHSCPRCGKKDRLKGTTSRLGRVKSMRPNLGGGMTVTSDILHLTVPVCEQHAAGNHLANFLLRNGPLALVLKAVVFMCMLIALAGLKNPSAVYRPIGPMTGVALFGIAGVALLFWARRTINIWPKAFDPDLDVVVIRFANEDYATKFRLMNREATSLRNTEQAPWLARASTWKMIIVVLALVFLGWRVLGSN
jgi:hypothetical protein